VLTACLAITFFCIELTIGPIWSVPMDIAPKHAGTAAGIMNTGSAVAAIISPTVFGFLVDWTGSWKVPFSGSIALLLIGAVLTFRTQAPVAIYGASGTGAWEAALVNTLSPGDRVLAFETGHFATLWKQLAERLGISVEYVPGDWRRGVDPAAVEARLAADKGHALKAVMVVHNETSTGVTSRVPEVRAAIDRAKHPALLLVDTISSLASIDYRHDAWGVDVTVAGSQKGLMLPPGLSFNAISGKALAAHKTAKLPRSYWDWDPLIAANDTGAFPYTPATNLLYGLQESIAM